MFTVLFFPPLAWKKVLISFSKWTAVKQKQQNSSCPACFQACLKVRG